MRNLKYGKEKGDVKSMVVDQYKKSKTLIDGGDKTMDAIAEEEEEKSE